MPASFRLAHVSDLHFCERQERLSALDYDNALDIGSRVMEVLERLFGDGLKPHVMLSSYHVDAAAALSRLLHGAQSGLDAILVTGDLATTGMDYDLKVAREFFDGKLPDDIARSLGLPLASLLANERNPVICIPGNHDRYEGIFLNPTSREFETHFGATWDLKRDHCVTLGSTGLIKALQLTSSESDAESLIVCFADFSLQDSKEGVGIWGYIGQGKAHSVIVEDLADVTKKLRAAYPTAGILWAVHFPPMWEKIDSNLRLLDEEMFVQAAERCEVTTVLAGHTHTDRDYKIADSSVSVLCAGSATGACLNHNYSFALLDITVDNGTVDVQRQVLQWDRHQKDFLTP